MSTSGSKSNEHVAHFLVDIHKKKIIVSCPYCGAEIGKSLSLEHTELTCLQCRSRLTVNYKNNVLTVRETIAEYTAK